jgi:hypothetical protein
VAETLKRTGTDVLVSYLPVGSQQATEFYAEQALSAGCAFVNCIPVFIASDPTWAERFQERRLPIVGDDIKSQVGATILHRSLVNLFRERASPSTDLSAELRRQHRLQEHARARAPDVEEAVEDRRGVQPARRAAPRRRHSISVRRISCRG